MSFKEKVYEQTEHRQRPITIDPLEPAALVSKKTSHFVCNSYRQGSVKFKDFSSTKSYFSWHYFINLLLEHFYPFL